MSETPTGGFRSGDVTRRALRRVTIGGCLAMVYVTGVTSPPFTQFARSLGATELDFGLLGGLPLVLYALQFVVATLNNSFRRRKPIFMASLITSRLLYLVLAAVPLLVPPEAQRTRVLLLIVLTAGSSALQNIGSPLWFSWMADLVPRRVLNRYWGTRQSWMFATWTLAYVAVAGFAYLSADVIGWSVAATYQALVVVAVLAGVVDILLFADVPEPPNARMEGIPLADVLLEPWRHTEYRSFLVYVCVRNGTVMFAATFMQLYILQELQLPLWQTVVAWCSMGVGTAVAGRAWGRIADRRGHRPVLTLAMCGKPIVVLVYLLITPDTAFVVLTVWLFFDGVMNSGTLVAENGYMLKVAPQRNRSMFIAAMTGLAGICAGLGALAGGVFLDALRGQTWTLLGREWSHFQMLFAVSFPLRFLNLALARRIREPRSSRTIHVLQDLRGAWPLHFFRLPAGLYRRPPK